VIQFAEAHITRRDRDEARQLDFFPQDFVVLNDVSEGGACQGYSGKAFPVEVVDDEVPKLRRKDCVGSVSPPFFFCSKKELRLKGRAKTYRPGLENHRLSLLLSRQRASRKSRFSVRAHSALGM